MKQFIYDNNTYNKNSALEVVPLILQMIKPKSVIDVGCGLGTWLRAFKEFGIIDYMGVEQHYNPNIQYFINKEKIIITDLTKPFILNRQYDVVLSLEVAEHLPQQNAEQFIQTLTSLGNIIIFSAAIPHQGGQNHLNEQWPTYWENIFKKYNFKFYDIIRKQIWNNNSVNWWYRQNIFIVAHESINITIPEDKFIMDLIHPALYLQKINEIDNLYKGKMGIKKSLIIFIRSIINKITSIIK